MVSLQPGEAFTGKIVFEVREDFELAKLSVEPHMFKKGFEIVPISKLIYKDNYEINHEGRQISLDKATKKD